MIQFFFIFMLALQTSADAKPSYPEAIWDTRQQIWMSLADLTQSARAGDIFIVGEEHATPDNADQAKIKIAHDLQVRLIQALQNSSPSRGRGVSVGMEFLDYLKQPVVDQFLLGALSESDFLTQTRWGKAPFSFYRQQILAPKSTRGKTVALNIPSAVSGKVARLGKDSLDASEKALLPPLWQRGNALYFARFQEAMAGHVTPSQLENFFWAQSLWDSTMAWKAQEALNQVSNHMLVIIVGAFHVEFGGGLPYELKGHGERQVKTIVPLAAPRWNVKTRAALIEPHAQYGERADYLWLFHAPP